MKLVTSEHEPCSLTVASAERTSNGPGVRWTKRLRIVIMANSVPAPLPTNREQKAFDAMSDRRDHVPFDPRYFERLAASGVRYSVKEVFDRVHRLSHWASPGSVSGEGATKSQTAELERAIPRLLRKLNVRSLLDLPCGDFGWMQRVACCVEHYVGADIVADLVHRNNELYKNKRCRFVVLDLTSDALPIADLLMCRDCLVHLSLIDIKQAFAQLRASRIKYLLATTFPETEHNEDAVTGDWRPLNLTTPPFNFPAPLTYINERCTEGAGRFSDKSLGLWLVEDLPSDLFWPQS